MRCFIAEDKKGKFQGGVNLIVIERIRTAGKYGVQLYRKAGIEGNCIKKSRLSNTEQLQQVAYLIKVYFKCSKALVFIVE